MHIIDTATTSTQLRMARAAVAWTVRDLSARSGVHRNTITRLELGGKGERRTIKRLWHALEAGGIVFMGEDGDGPGVRFRKM
jgi:transcriptional regulator with XRE-family HTH domain